METVLYGRTFYGEVVIKMSDEPIRGRNYEIFKALAVRSISLNQCRNTRLLLKEHDTDNRHQFLCT